MKEATVAASEFKAKCLRMLDEVAEQGQTLIITKHGRPVARVTPVPKRDERLAVDPATYKMILHPAHESKHLPELQDIGAT